MSESLVNKVAGTSSLQLYQKETPTRMFSCEFCLIFRAAFLNSTYERLPLEMPCRIYCFNLSRFPCCNGIKFERTFGDTWVMLILVAAIFDLI